MKTSFTSISTVIILFSTSSLFGQNSNGYAKVSITASHSEKENTHRPDSISHTAQAANHSTAHHSENGSKAVSTTVHHSALSTHKVFHHRAPESLTPAMLVTGHTYNRYGEKASPKGYGIQVVSFKKIKNLQKFLHTYHKKDMYIQVVVLDPAQKEQMYRVVLGAEENISLIEKELSLFQSAGVSAVLRKHKTAE
jgi:hypothetical protein